MKKIVAVLVALAVAGTACGGSDDSNANVVGFDDAEPTEAPVVVENAAGGVDGSQSGQEAEQTQEPVPTSAPPAASSDSSGSSESPDAASSDGSGSSAAPTVEPAAEPTSEPFDQNASEERAQELLQGIDDWCEASEVLDAQFDGTANFTFNDPEALERQYRDTLTMVRGIKELVPAEIEADVATTVEGLELLVDELDKADWNFLNLSTVALDQFDVEMEQASYNLNRYQFEQCGIGVDPGEFEASLDAEPPPISSEGELPTGSIGDELLEGFIAGGFTEEEATCLVDNLDLSDPAAMAEMSAMLELFSDCGIPFERLAELGG